MIKEIEIKDFRCIDYLKLDLKQISILVGANAIGKSTVLNAVNFGIVGTNLTDKWGVGENDQDVNFPRLADGSYKENTTPSVTLTLDSGAAYTKRMVKGKKGNSIEYLVNGVSMTKTKYEDELFTDLNLIKKLKCSKDVSEVKLFTDPLYPLQKLDAKALRTLLVELGCGATNEEVFQVKEAFNLLREFESKYKGDYTVMRTNLKAERLELNKQLELNAINLSNYADVGTSFDDTTRKALEDAKFKLITTINELNNGSKDVASDVKDKIKELQHQRQFAILNFQNEKNLKVGKLDAEFTQAVKDMDAEKNKQIQAINNQIQLKSQQLLTINQSMTAYNNTRNNKRYEAQRYQDQEQQLFLDTQNAKAEIEKAKQRQFIGYVTCPDCGKVFAPDVAALTLFNKQKQDDIARYEKTIEDNDIKMAQIRKALDECITLGREAKKQMEEVEPNLEAIKQEIDALNEKKSDIANMDVDVTKVNKCKKTLDEAKREELDTSSYDLKISTLESQLRDAIVRSQEANAEAIRKAKEQLDQVEEQIKATYQEESKVNSKIECLKAKETLTSKLNDTEYLLELVNQFIQTKIKLINSKAKDITGIDFVMLEENISNDGIKEVCYATVNGVEFGQVNTSEKMVVGIQFIHKIKEILGANNLPILADRLEGFDDLEKIKNLTTEQLICTVVGNKNQKQIVIL